MPRAANSIGASPILLNFESNQDFMAILVIICKSKEDPIEHEGARVFTTLFIDFTDSHWQITP